MVLKIKETCHLENTKPEKKPFNFLDISIRSRDMRENRTWSVCKAAILKFPAKQDIVFKIKEMCHLENTKPEKNPFNFLRYFF